LEEVLLTLGSGGINSLSHYYQAGIDERNKQDTTRRKKPTDNSYQAAERYVVMYV